MVARWWHRPRRRSPGPASSQVTGGSHREAGTGIEPVMGDLQARSCRFRASPVVPLSAVKTHSDLRRCCRPVPLHSERSRVVFNLEVGKMLADSGYPRVGDVPVASHSPAHILHP